MTSSANNNEQQGDSGIVRPSPLAVFKFTTRLNFMARAGMGYEISYAYTNFDNATMYADPDDPAAIDCRQQPAFVLGESAARQKGAEVTEKEERAPLR